MGVDLVQAEFAVLARHFGDAVIKVTQLLAVELPKVVWQVQAAEEGAQLVAASLDALLHAGVLEKVRVSVHLGLRI